jgi:hypothetical protein
MRIIFLDIDGVLRTKQGPRRAVVHPGEPIPDLWDEHALRNLNKLIEKTGANIVITSTWRLGESLESLRKLLNEKGIHGVVIGKTPELGEITIKTPNRKSRGQEIEAWLKQQKGQFRFVILDGNPGLMPEQKPFAVICEPENGFADDAKYHLAFTILTCRPY